MNEDNDLVQNLQRNLNETLGPKNECLANDGRLNFGTDLGEFLGKLKEDDLKKLGRAVSFFRLHMEPIWYLTRGEAKVKVSDYFKEHVWAQYAVSIIFSILDETTRDIDAGKSDFLGYLKDNFKRIQDSSDLDKLSKEYKTMFPPQSIVRRMREVFKNYLTVKEQEQLINNYRAVAQKEGKLKIDNLDDVISDIHNHIRSGFLHNMGFEAMDTQSTIFKLPDKPQETPTLEVHQTVSAEEFVLLCWKAIFRFYGYKGNMDSNYTQEEKDRGESYHGRKISFRLG